MELKGNLSNFSLPDIVQLVGSTRRTGVLVVTVGPDQGEVYFEEGRIVHAGYREHTGQEAMNRIFREREGSFQFLSEVEAPERTVMLEWMNVLMEAARLDDEGRRDGDLDFELDLEGGAEASPGPERPPQPAWDGEAVKQKMAHLLTETFGKKAKKITAELEKDAGTKLSLLEFCDKAEKYVYVFIDNKRSEGIGRELRHLIDESVR